jgi:hypothetical protein
MKQSLLVVHRLLVPVVEQIGFELFAQAMQSALVAQVFEGLVEHVRFVQVETTDAQSVFAVQAFDGWFAHSLAGQVFAPPPQSVLVVHVCVLLFAQTLLVLLHLGVSSTQSALDTHANRFLVCAFSHIGHSGELVWNGVLQMSWLP